MEQTTNQFPPVSEVSQSASVTPGSAPKPNKTPLTVLLIVIIIAILAVVTGQVLRMTKGAQDTYTGEVMENKYAPSGQENGGEVNQAEDADVQELDAALRVDSEADLQKIDSEF